MPGGTKGKMFVKKQELEDASVTWAKDYPKDACTKNSKNSLSGDATCYCAASDPNKNTNTLPDNTRYLDICTKDRPYCGKDGYCYSEEANYKNSVCPTDEATGKGGCLNSCDKGLARKYQNNNNEVCPDGQVCCITECESDSNGNYGNAEGKYYCIPDNNKGECDPNANQWDDNKCPDKDGVKYGCCKLKQSV